MAEPLLSFLTGRARAALPFLRSAARQGLTPTAAIALVEKLGETFNRQRMLDVYAALQPRVDPERAARLVGQNNPIPQELHRTSPVTLHNPYEYVVVATDESGQDVGGVTIASNVPLSAAVIHKRAGIFFKEQAEAYLSTSFQNVAAQSIEEANVSPEVPPE